MIVECLLLARESILHIDHRLKRRGLQYKRTYFLQPDVVFDASGEASLVEVHTPTAPPPRDQNSGGARATPQPTPDLAAPRARRR